MASSIRYIPGRKEEIIEFLETADSGDATVFDFDTGNRGYMLQLIKKGKFAYGYYTCKWYFRRGPQKPIVRLSKDYIEWLVKYRKNSNKPLFDESIMGNYQERVKAFFRSGIFPEYNKYYAVENGISNGKYNHRGYGWTKNAIKDYKNNPMGSKASIIKKWSRPYNGNGIGLRYLRSAQLVNFSGTETPMFHKCKFTWDGKLLSKIPKDAIKIRNGIIKTDNDINSRNRRMNYANTKIVAKIKKAQESGDWSKLEVKEIFTLRNVTHRTALINHFGMETVLGQLNYDCVDKEKLNGNEYELLSVEIPDTRPGVEDNTTTKGNYLKMTNPTTGEIHIEGVANSTSTWMGYEIDTVKMALGWRDGELRDFKRNSNKKMPEYVVPQIIT